MRETFYLSNIVPQNYENNAGFWNRCVVVTRSVKYRIKKTDVNFLKGGEAA